MEYLFDSKESIARLREELESWENTPFRHLCGVKGMGCDCIHFVVRIIETFGLGPFKVPEYPKDWHLHRSEELLKRGLTSQVPHIEINPFDPKDGDILLFKFGRVCSHAGIFCDENVWQSLSINRSGVKKMSFNDPYLYSRMKFGIRPLKR